MENKLGLVAKAYRYSVEFREIYVCMWICYIVLRFFMTNIEFVRRWYSKLDLVKNNSIQRKGY